MDAILPTRSRGIPITWGALQHYGCADEAASMVQELEEGYTRRYFTGGCSSGVEFIRWDGVLAGYGTFVMSFNTLYGNAIE